MSQKSGSVKESAEKVVQNIRRATRKRYSVEEKIRIVLEGLRGEDSIAELWRREGISQNLYYRWSKEFLEAGKRRLAGDTAREATSGEVTSLRRESGALKAEEDQKRVRGTVFPTKVAELMLENRLLKKSMTGQTLLAFAEEATNEIPRLREAGDHPAGRAIASAGQAHAGQAWHSPALPFTGGMIATRRVARRRWKIGARAPAVCGTGSQMRFGSGFWSWLWMSPSCHRANWRCASPTGSATSSRKPRSIGC